MFIPEIDIDTRRVNNSVGRLSWSIMDHHFLENGEILAIMIIKEGVSTVQL